MKNIRLLAIANTIGLITALVLNYLANALPLNGKTTGELSDAYPNLFVPAGFTFAIWGVIYLTLIGFVIYQLRQAFSKTGNTDFIAAIGWWFVISCLANASWIVAWHFEQVAVALGLMLCILISLIMIYQKLQIGLVSVSSGVKWLVYLPFSIYLGWITVATIANTTAFLVDLNWDGFGVAPEIWTIIVMSVGTFIGLTMLQKRKDIAYVLVIIWAYYGIISKRMAIDGDVYSNITITAMVGIGLITLEIIRSFFRKN